MTMVADVIFPFGGVKFPPHRQRRRDALLAYARHHAREAGVPFQTWVRETWSLKDYQTKDLVRGNGSEAIYEQLLHRSGPHLGFKLGLAILEAVTATTLAEQLATEREAIANEKAAWAAEESRIAALEAAAQERRSFARDTRWSGAVPAGRRARGRRLDAARMGSDRD